MAKSKANSKLKNVEAVRKMLDGSHKTQTKKVFGYTKVKERKKVGDSWKDENGYEWEQKDGYKVRHGKMDEARKYLQSFPNCSKETCTCTTPSRADLKMKKFHGMCLDCVVDMEHEIRIKGGDAWEKYENKKIYENAKSWMKQAEGEVGDILKVVDKAEFVNSDGTMEKWHSDFDKKKFKKKVKKSFKRFEKNFLNKLEENEE